MIKIIWKIIIDWNLLNLFNNKWCKWSLSPLKGFLPFINLSKQTLNNSKAGKITNIKIKFIEILSFLYSVKKRNEKINPNKYDPLFPKNIFPLIFKMKKNNKVIPKVTKKKLKTL